MDNNPYYEEPNEETDTQAKSRNIFNNVQDCEEHNHSENNYLLITTVQLHLI